jgi:hypothetical protein
MEPVVERNEKGKITSVRQRDTSVGQLACEWLVRCSYKDIGKRGSGIKGFILTVIGLDHSHSRVESQHIAIKESLNGQLAIDEAVWRISLKVRSYIKDFSTLEDPSKRYYPRGLQIDIGAFRNLIQRISTFAISQISSEWTSLVKDLAADRQIGPCRPCQLVKQYLLP